MDRAALFEALRGATARVAISGYGDEWDGLGWVKTTKHGLSSQGKGGEQQRAEALWQNFDPPNRLF